MRRISIAAAGELHFGNALYPDHLPRLQLTCNAPRLATMVTPPRSTPTSVIVRLRCFSDKPRTRPLNETPWTALSGTEGRRLNLPSSSRPEPTLPVAAIEPPDQ